MRILMKNVDRTLIKRLRLAMDHTLKQCEAHILEKTGIHISDASISRTERELQWPTKEMWHAILQAYNINPFTNECPFCGNVLENKLYEVIEETEYITGRIETNNHGQHPLDKSQLMTQELIRDVKKKQWVGNIKSHQVRIKPIKDEKGEES